MVNEEIIFDLGFHNGDDTDFYLKKGFKVIAVEANPDLVKEGIKRFQKYIDEKKLIIVNKAISDKRGHQDFYIHPNKSDWSSCDKKLAESDGSQSKMVSVETTSLNSLYQEFGAPRYIKVDVEGCDVMVAKQLYELENKPQYISFETSKRDYAGIFAWLFVSGYIKFQLVNQSNNPNRIKDNQNSFEGKNINYNFTMYSSGFFGKDLSESNWVSFDEALARYVKYRELKFLDNKELALGWIDVHASL